MGVCGVLTKYGEGRFRGGGGVGRKWGEVGGSGGRGKWGGRGSPTMMEPCWSTYGFHPRTCKSGCFQVPMHNPTLVVCPYVMLPLRVYPCFSLSRQILRTTEYILYTLIVAWGRVAQCFYFSEYLRSNLMIFRTGSLSGHSWLWQSCTMPFFQTRRNHQSMVGVV